MRIKKIVRKITCDDVLTNSPNKYHKKYIENSEENIHVDLNCGRVVRQ